MNWWLTLKQPPWRTIVPGLLLVLLVPLGYWAWTPGLELRDGRHDLEQNGLWLAHGWLGADEWFTKNGKTNQFDRYRSPEALRMLSARLRQHHIKDVFPHLCPAEADGTLAAIHDLQAERLLDALPGVRVLPWIGGPNGGNVRARDSRWRAAFANAIHQLLAAHPRFAGIHLNVEPLTSGDGDFLKLLEEVRRALPERAVLSVAAYPPPTRWQPVEDVHWDETYFRQVAVRSDQLVVMMYDTALRKPKLYERLMADWTTEVLNWSEGKEVLLGLPAYEDTGVDYHSPEVENLKTALRGVHRGLSRGPLPKHYRGVAIYSDWVMDEAEWSYFRDHFLKPAR